LPKDYKAPTFGDKVAAGELIHIHCRGCARSVEVVARALPPGIPHETPFPAIKRYLRCARCGGRDISILPEVYPGGFIGNNVQGELKPSRALMVPRKRGF